MAKKIEAPEVSVGVAAYIVSQSIPAMSHGLRMARMSLRQIIGFDLIKDGDNKAEFLKTAQDAMLAIDEAELISGTKT